MQDDWRASLLERWFEQKAHEGSAPIPDYIQEEMLDSSFKFSKQEWKETLRHYHYKCAYCQSRPFQSPDHFWPYSRGGQTALDNLVPACRVCNSIKREQLPDEITFVAKSVIIEIQTYLASKRKERSRKEGYIATFSRSVNRMEKKEFYRNIDEINVRLRAIKRAEKHYHESIAIISLGVAYHVDHVLVGIEDAKQNEYAHCTFVCTNHDVQIYELPATKEYVEDYLKLLRTFCVRETIFIDWNKLEENK